MLHCEEQFDPYCLLLLGLLQSSLSTMPRLYYLNNMLLIMEFGLVLITFRDLHLNYINNPLFSNFLKKHPNKLVFGFGTIYDLCSLSLIQPNISVFQSYFSLLHRKLLFVIHHPILKNIYQLYEESKLFISCN